MLVYAAILYNHDVAGLVIESLAVVDVVSFTT